MQTLIIPPHTTPIAIAPQGTTDDLRQAIEGSLMSHSWWLQLSNLSGFITGMVQYGANAARLKLNAQKIPNGAVYVESDTGLGYQVRSGAWVCIFGTQRIPLSLTTATTNIDAPSSGAPKLVYFIDQDGIGGRAIHWRNGFGWASDSLGGMMPLRRSVFHFVLDSASRLYVQSGQPTTDMVQ